MPPLRGVMLAAGACGLRYKGRNDVLLVKLAHGASVAGVFTRSLTASAPVEWCRKALHSGTASALLVNSGNANAFTGAAGDRALEDTVKAVADLFPCRPSTVFAASTGVIGEPLDGGKIIAVLPDLENNLKADSWKAAAEAIMTTDTFAKGAVRVAAIGDVKVTINGIAKGSGMIAPDMATMLAFVFTDAAIPSDVLQKLLGEAVNRSFNCTTVDGDTSTSDTLLLFATGEGDKHLPVTDADDRHLADFRRALNEVMLDLALQVVRDGEGASKLISITVNGAENEKAARAIGLSIANSPLVKTAVAAEDANWGRIVMAVGKAGERADRDKLSIIIGGHPVAENGAAVAGYDETPVAGHMKGAEIDIAVDVGIGKGSATVWTCDLTHGYIDINAKYRS
ncbi:MAG: bifunctional ornithine acetyltransferase/N-acetylglutamate synthase [Rhodospirillales bacterium RIFCSPLOWO2_12_FULL_58_28]|nr:MAG: bifunctional ornithine acetyltransferase/N-acetylglutamate synthase [Rhodospirillales bacterium RIFCSPLOWO2_02_FULL_58_16]OHC77930.1 MAG: bifunctional ornithine acetyltransferase/N-acetylglutamate synthase [Rhodospirillales bacterium RIFCSPLOWO2_12_FULL_58_28]